MVAEAQIVVPVAAPEHQDRWKRLALLAAAAPIMLLTTGYAARVPQIVQAISTPEPPASALADAGAADLPQLALGTDLMPVSADEAERLNSERATDLAKIVAAQPFTVKDQFRADPRFQTALQCLTQAVFYEAGYEPDAGQRAVAQVVLNRVRHPGYPHSVCGVVYQGSNLPTGCQFTFTCDGSLLRTPPQAAWDRARRVALAALSGWVEPSVGLSTHYHATYVVPYWAPTLSKVALIGQHIFYALPGQSSNRAAFQARYDFSSEFAPSASERLAYQPLDTLDELSPTVAGQNADLLSRTTTLSGTAPAQRTDLEADRTASIEAPPPSSPLRADQDRGVLNARGSDSKLVVD
ncbi:MAG TPA: cell wall hydrolase [Croceibacterium sp.]|nr:cell wall hydrolase [Croceibacterium sp.]